MRLNLVQLVDHRRPVISDQDASPITTRGARWLNLSGWAVALAFVGFLLGLILQDAFREARERSEFKRQLVSDQREMQAILQQMAHGNAEQRRIAADIKALQQQGRAQR